MFPLGSVLLPGMPLPLRLFEPRYLAMLGDVLELEPPAFGVVLIERGHEVGGGESRYDVGTLARVNQVQTTEDVAVLIAHGTDRVRVHRWLEDDPYPRAELERVDPLTWDEDLRPALEQAEASVRSTLARASEFVELMWSADTELADDPVERCWQLAGIAMAGPFDQVQMLRSTTVPELLERSVTACTEALEAITFGRT